MNEATGRVDTLLLRTAQLAGPRAFGAGWPRLAPVVETAIRQYAPTLGLVWPWEAEFWNRLTRPIFTDEGKLVSGYEGFSTYDRNTIKPPAPAPAPKPPAGAYTSTPGYDLLPQQQAADREAWLDWRTDAIPELPPELLGKPLPNADELLWVAAGLGVIGLILAFRKSK